MSIPNYCMITPSYPPVMGGVERHVYELHQALNKLGMNGRILVLGRQPKSGVLPNTYYINKPQQQWIRARRALLKGVGRDPYVQAVVGFLQEDPDAILHFHDYHTVYPFLPALKRTNLLKRVFLTFHGWEGVYPPKKKVIKARQKCANTVKGNIAVGDFIPAWYGTTSDKITYGAVNVNNFPNCPEPKVEPFQLLYLGQFREDTGILTLLSGLDRMYMKNDITVKLHAYGSGVLTPALEEHDFVTVHQPVNQVSELLSDFPIVIASGYLSILEALYCRRVVIALYENPGRESYLRMHPMAKYLFLCRDTVEMEAALNSCITNWDETLKCFEPAWKWAQKQTWSDMAGLYLNLWNV